ncbi:MAG: ferrous iron transport protein B, partial [Desulfomonilaceae bacterium]
MSDGEITIALAGNPNSGKTTIFNALTGAHQHVGNWPGVTVEKKEGHATRDGKRIHIVDLPGTYSLRAAGLDEQIARDFLLDGSVDAVVCVADASNLERNLYLAVQIMEMGVRVILDLNMIDVAARRGIEINTQRLSELLGIPVIVTNGAKGQGVSELLDAIVKTTAVPLERPTSLPVTYPSDFEDRIRVIEEYLQASKADLGKLPTRWLAIKLLERDAGIETRVKDIVQLNGLAKEIAASRERLQKTYGESVEHTLAGFRYGLISGVMKQIAQTDVEEQVYLSEKIDKILTHRLLGPLLLLVILYAMFQFTFTGSEPLVNGLKSLFDWLGDAASEIIPEGALRSLVKSGIIDGVGAVLAFTPVIALLFVGIAIAEDSGYLARIAFMVDRVLRPFGLHGSSIL